MTFKHVRTILVALLVLLGTTPLYAEGQQEIAQNLPVAMVAAVKGDAQIKYPNQDWRKCYALDLLGPEVQLKTGSDGTITSIFFFDDHREIVASGSEAKLSFHNIEKINGDVTREVSKSGGNEFEVPYIILVRLKSNLFVHADDPGEAEKEDGFLQGLVKVNTYPPVFTWKDSGAPKYRLQLFNEHDEFIYEAVSAKPTYKFPYNPTFRLIKTGEYYWQVQTPNDDMVVRKYGFRLLTLPLVKALARAEADFDAVQKRQPGETSSFTELFLVYSQYHALDKIIHHLERWTQVSPDNPNVYRYLCRAYLLKGCPLKARQALEKAVHLGANDPILP
jgi:hypothetical protein